MTVIVFLVCPFEHSGVLRVWWGPHYSHRTIFCKKTPCLEETVMHDKIERLNLGIRQLNMMWRA